MSVSRNVPFGPALFDLAVIDEASQSDIASALPILFRARRAVIIGDEMQLRPVAQLGRTFDRQLAGAYGIDLAAFGLFGFSNRWFYQDQLRVRTVAGDGDGDGVVWHDIRGEARPRWTNPSSSTRRTGFRATSGM
ncbi:MAG: AAA domain-containing protein [Pirellulales bacterium]